MLRASKLNVCAVQHVECTHDEKQIRAGRLLLKLNLHLVRHFEQLEGLGITTHHEIAHVARPSRHKMMGIKSPRHDIVELQQRTRDVAAEGAVCECEVCIVIEHVKLLSHGLSGQVFPCKCHQLVKHAQGIA